MACRGSGVRVPVAPPTATRPPIPHPSPARRGVNRLRGDRDRTTSRTPHPDRALRPDDDRAALAGALGRARAVSDGPLRHRAAQVLPADDVPVSVGRHPHRPLVHHHADRRDRPLPSDARRERVPADRLRCVRAAGRERRDQEQHQPARLDDVEHRQHAPPAADDGRDVRLGGGGRHRRSRLLPLEPVVLPPVPEGRPRLPPDVAGRLVPQRRDARPRAGRGRRPPLLALRREGREARPGPVVPARSPSTPTSCSTSAACSGPSRSRPSRRTGSGGARAARSSSRPRRPSTTRAAPSCASSRPARTRCSGRRSWSSPPSTRSSPS